MAKNIAPLVNMVKEGYEKLLVLLIFYFFLSQKSNLTFATKNLKWGEISL